jgi:autoinducer 2-degrading protein
MAYTLAITLKCRPGAAETFRRVLGEITSESRDETGNVAFVTHESLEEPDVFLVYESYRDEAAYQAHLATPAFARVEAELFPLVAEREVRAYAPIEPRPSGS